MFRTLNILVCGVILLSPVVALAQGVITDGNARWEYNNAPGTPGSSNLEPDSGGAPDDNMTQNWWWYRITSGPGFSIAEAPLSWPPSNQTYAGDTAILSDSEPSFDWELTVTVADDPMIGNANVTEVLSIENTTGSDIVITIFNYADFAVGADELDDTSVLLGAGHVGFFDDSPLLSAELEAPDGTGDFQVGPPATLLALLNDSTTLNPDNDPTPMGPGNLAGIVEYERSISPGGMVTLDELLRVNFVPEPATAALVLIGIMAGLRRRRLGQ